VPKNLKLKLLTITTSI